MSLQKLGGVAALFEALAYVVGFVVAATLMSPENAAGWNSQQKLAFLLERKLLVQVWNLTIYMAFGVALVVLVIALHERLKAGALAMAQIASAFGLIWCGLVIASGMVSNVGLEAVGRVFPRDPAFAASAWLAIGAVQDALGGGVELVGGLWLLLISWAALRSGVLGKRLNQLGLAIGSAGVLTMIPGLSELGSVFGLGQIIWFAWLGTSLLRPSATLSPSPA